MSLKMETLVFLISRQLPVMKQSVGIRKISLRNKCLANKPKFDNALKEGDFFIRLGSFFWSQVESDSVYI